MKRETAPAPAQAIGKICSDIPWHFSQERRAALRANDEATAAATSAPMVKAQIDQINEALSAERAALATAEGGATLKGSLRRLLEGLPRAEEIARHKAKIDMLLGSLAAGEQTFALAQAADMEQANGARQALQRRAREAMRARLLDLHAVLEAAVLANEYVRLEWQEWQRRGAGFATVCGDPCYPLLSLEGIQIWRRNCPFKF